MAQIEIQLNQAGGVEEIINFELSKADFIAQVGGEYYIKELYIPPVDTICISTELVINKILGNPLKSDITRVPTTENFNIEINGNNLSQLGLGGTALFKINSMGLLRQFTNNPIYLQIQEQDTNNFTLKGYIKIMKLTV